MKAIKLTALLCVLALFLGGCDLLFPTADVRPSEVYTDPEKYADEFRDCLQYQQLSEAQKQSYGQIYTAVRDAETQNVTITNSAERQVPGVRIPLSDATLSREEMSHLFEAFFRDNPRFFYLDRTYSLEGYEKDGKPVYNTLLLQFTMDAAKRSTALRELDTATQAILRECPSTTDEYTIELYLHNRLLSLCEYDDYAASVSSNECANAYSAYGALVEGKAVCEGYAKAMQLLLNTCSISATVVLGNAVEDNEAHMWNLVHINDEYYYLDPTWNDDEAGIRYTYFNITSSMLSHTHTIDANNQLTANCTALTDNYHYRNGTYIDTYERDVIAEVIANKIQRGETIVHLRFAEGKYENALLFLKNLSLAQKTVNKFLSGGTMWTYELYTQPKQNTITVTKK